LISSFEFDETHPSKSSIYATRGNSVNLDKARNCVYIVVVGHFFWTMRVNIDIEKSIETGRLRPVELSWNNYSSIGLYIFLASIFILVGLVMPTLFIVNMMKQNNLSGLWLMLLFYVPGVLTLYGLAKDNRLKKFHGRDIETNKQTMVSVIKDKFKTDLVYQGENMMTYYKRPTFWKFGTRLIVCFNEDIVMINISKFNQYGLKSFFHQLFVDRTVNSMIKEFNHRVRS
jgi:hypothetical protein